MKRKAGPGSLAPAQQLPMGSGILSRREFLKLSGASLAALVLSRHETGRAMAVPAPRQGRVVYTSLVVRNAPAFNGTKVKSYRRDTLLEISEELLGGVESDYNRTWFRLVTEGFVYSGGVQPVSTRFNLPVQQVPATGVLGDITIPFTDSTWAINRSPTPGPRLYYASTHWITALVLDKRDGSQWYQAFDNLYNTSYYIRPEAVRILPDQELSPLSDQVPDNEKHIEVSLERQLLVAFESGTPVFAARVATGKVHYETPTGWFTTFHKRPTYHMTGGGDVATMFDLPGVPWDSYFTDSGAAMHGTYWHNDFGTPHSHGCVNMTPADARWIFRWSLPTVPGDKRLVLEPGQGTRVLVTRN